MGLFFEILSSINNPNQRGSVDQLSTIMNTVQRLGADHGLDANKTQTLLSSLGEFLGPALKQQGAAVGGQPLESLVGQLAGNSAGVGGLQSFLTPQLQQQMVQGLAQKTGLPNSLLQSLLPTLIPAVLGFLNLGASKPGVLGTNPVLNAFLNNDRANSNDLGDVFKFANRFLNSSH